MNSRSIVHVVDLKENAHPNIAVNYPTYTRCRKSRVRGPQYTFSITTKPPVDNNNINNNNAPFKNTNASNNKITVSTGGVPIFQSEKGTGLLANKLRCVARTHMHTVYGPLDWRECTDNKTCACSPGPSSRPRHQYYSHEGNESYILNSECQRIAQMPQPSYLGQLSLENFLSQAPLQQKFCYKLRTERKL